MTANEIQYAAKQNTSGGWMRRIVRRLPVIGRFLTLYERALITIGDESCDDNRGEIVARLKDDDWWAVRRSQGSTDWKPGQVGWKDFPYA